MDRPAAITVFVVGVILILVSIPLFSLVQPAAGAGGRTYTVAWSEDPVAATSPVSPNAGNAVRLTIPVSGVLLSNVTVTLTTTDNRGPGNAFPAATCTWSLTRDDVAVGSGTDCSTTGISFELGGHPDIAEVQGSSRAAAYAKLWNRAGFLNSTADVFVLEFEWTRGQGQLPIPPQNTAFTGTVELEVAWWDAALNEKTAEGAR